MKRAVLRFAVAAALSMATLALAPVAAPAEVKFHAGSIQYANKAQLQEDGTVLMTFTYECVPSKPVIVGEPSGRIEVQVSNTEAEGFAVAPATCDDRKHTVTLDIGPGPFKPGSAFADARLFSGAFNFVAEKQAEISIK